MHTIIDLRRHLFETLEALRDKKNPMDVDRAEAVAHVAQTIVNSCRVECDYLEILGGDGTGFCPDADAQAAPKDGLRLIEGRRLKG
jgi:hypothetical protein